MLPERFDIDSFQQSTQKKNSKTELVHFVLEQQHTLISITHRKYGRAYRQIRCPEDIEDGDRGRGRGHLPLLVLY